MRAVWCRAVEMDGRPSRDGELLIRLLHLNEDPALSVRRYRLTLLALKQDYPTDDRVHHLFLQSFAYPPLADLPNLRSLRPPAGNSLAANARTCFHARRKQSRWRKSTKMAGADKHICERFKAKMA